MEPAWTPEIVVTAPMARRLVEEQFPELAPAVIEPLGAGWDNTAYCVNGSHVFRFPRRAVAVPWLETEVRLLPAIAAVLPLPIPGPDHAGKPSAVYPWPFSGYRRISGRTAAAADLDDSQRANLAGILGRFLAALHAVPAEQASACGAGPDTLGRLDLPRRVDRARRTLDALWKQGALANHEPLRALLDAAPGDIRPRGDVLVHGDLYAAHLLVDEVGQLSGIIDWGDVHLGDPAIDLAIAHAFLPPSAHPAFLKAYGPVGELTWRRARLRALWHALLVLEYSLDLPDPVLTCEMRQALSYVAAAA